MGSTPYNRSNFIVRYIHQQKFNRILIDNESAVNIFLLNMIEKLEVPLDMLSQSRLMIQGFNGEGQWALTKVKLELFIDDM